MGRFRYYLRVRYGECDAQKVVFNARYADYIDLSTIEFLRALGFGSALVNGTLDYQLVKLTLEWKSPARFDQVLELLVSATRLGNTSFTICTEFRIAGDEPVIAVGETVYVVVDTSQGSLAGNTSQTGLRMRCEGHRAVSAATRLRTQVQIVHNQGLNTARLFHIPPE